MTLEITTPLLGKTKKSAKDLVISTLRYDYPLTLAKLTNLIRKKFAASVTFQGVRKSVNHLAEEGVVVKEGKEYLLNKEWILKLHEFAEDLQESYFSESSGIKNSESLGEDIKVYTFDNLIDLDRFWNKIIEKWFEEDKYNKSEKYYVQQAGHTWYVLANLEEETKTMDQINKYGVKFYTLATGSTFLDKWCRKYYEKQGFRYLTKVGQTSHYFAVYGDNIIQCDYPTELVREIDQIYKQTKDFENFSVADLIKVLLKKTELKLLVMRNPIVAEQLKSSILSSFRKSA